MNDLMNDSSFSSDDIHMQKYPLLGTVHKILKSSPILLSASNPHASIQCIIMAAIPATKVLHQPFTLFLPSVVQYAYDSVFSSLIHC